MAVDFCDYFWGEKHDGFQVLYNNMKCGVVAAKDLTDVVRETALIQEYNSKAYNKLSKQLGHSQSNAGSFSPILASLKLASDKLCQVHAGSLAKINELMKELIRYYEELHKKHKQIKDEESPTSDVVKNLQETSSLLVKSKEFYKAKAAELEKLKRENPSPKELEKAESKFRKAQEDYKHLVDKYGQIREDFEKKMMLSCKHYQQAETLHLTQMADFVQSYHELIDRNHIEIGKVHLELEAHLVQNTVEKMLEQFVLQKYTGLVKPGPVEFEEEKVSLASLNVGSAGGGPPSDISDRSGGSDKGVGIGPSSGSMGKKESSGGGEEGGGGDQQPQADQQSQAHPDLALSLSATTTSAMLAAPAIASAVQETTAAGHQQEAAPHCPSPVGGQPASNNSGQPSTTQSQQTGTAHTPNTESGGLRSPYATLANWSVTGFLKNRRKKERSGKKSKGAKDADGDAENKDIGSDGEERGPSETPTPDQLDEHGYHVTPGELRTTPSGAAHQQHGRITPANMGGSTDLLANDPWADFHQPAKPSFYSSSDSDSEDEEIKKIRVNIKPVTSTSRSATSASVDELQRAVGGIDLSATLPHKRYTPSVEVDRLTSALSSASNLQVKRSQSTTYVGQSKHAQEIASLFTLPPTTAEATSNIDTNITSGDGKEEQGSESRIMDPNSTSGAASNKEVTDLLNNIHGLVQPNQPARDGENHKAMDNSFLQTSSSSNPDWTAKPGGGGNDSDWAEQKSGGNEPNWPASSSSSNSPWPDPIGWGSSNDSSVQPALPPKQRPSSVQREKIANSLISLPRPPSRARPEPRLRGTPSPTPTSFLQTTNLSLARTDSFGSTGSGFGERRDSGSSGTSNSKYGGHPPELPAKMNSGRLQSRNNSVSQNDLSKHLLGDLTLTSAGASPRVGPYMPAPHGTPPTLPRPSSRPARSSIDEDSLAPSESGPPPGPPPPLPPSAGASAGPGFGTSRGPSPLTLSNVDTLPLAVAFQEVVHAAFRGSEESRCLVRLLGDMMLSFPAGIVNVLASNPYPAPLQFRIKNSKRLESVLPNKQLISKVKNQCTEDCLVFEFNMNNLQELLNKQSQINPVAHYFNIDILKYQVTALPGAGSCPFQMVSYWKCETDHTDLRLDFKYNQHAMARATPLLNVTLAVPVDGGVTNMTCQPKGHWNADTNRALWKFPDLSPSQNGGVGTVRARFQLTDGPGSQGTVAAQFNCEGTTLSGVEFELKSPGYRVSLVKRRFVSGKYISEPDPTTDKYRYAAPPPVSGEI